MQNQSSRGFTIVELIVVIAIIGLLAAVVSFNIGESRLKARDVKRVADLDQVHLALKAYYSLYDEYPSEDQGACAYNTSFLPGGCLEVLIDMGIFDALPDDPDPTKNYSYDNWCQDPGPGVTTQQFRMWASGEGDHNGLDDNWWNDNTIGVTLCSDPS